MVVASPWSAVFGASLSLAGCSGSAATAAEAGCAASAVIGALPLTAETLAAATTAGADAEFEVNRDRATTTDSEGSGVVTGDPSPPDDVAIAAALASLAVAAAKTKDDEWSEVAPAAFEPAAAAAAGCASAAAAPGPAASSAGCAAAAAAPAASSQQHQQLVVPLPQSRARRGWTWPPDCRRRRENGSASQFAGRTLRTASFCRGRQLLLTQRYRGLVGVVVCFEDTIGDHDCVVQWIKTHAQEALASGLLVFRSHASVGKTTSHRVGGLFGDNPEYLFLVNLDNDNVPGPRLIPAAPQVCFRVWARPSVAFGVVVRRRLARWPGPAAGCAAAGPTPPSVPAALRGVVRLVGRMAYRARDFFKIGGGYQDSDIRDKFKAWQSSGPGEARRRGHDGRGPHESSGPDLRPGCLLHLGSHAQPPLSAKLLREGRSSSGRLAFAKPPTRMDLPPAAQATAAAAAAAGCAAATAGCGRGGTTSHPWLWPRNNNTHQWNNDGYG